MAVCTNKIYRKYEKIALLFLVNYTIIKLDKTCFKDK